jgi:hypothetical protein
MLGFLIVLESIGSAALKALALGKSGVSAVLAALRWVYTLSGSVAGRFSLADIAKALASGVTVASALAVILAGLTSDLNGVLLALVGVLTSLHTFLIHLANGPSPAPVNPAA